MPLSYLGVAPLLPPGRCRRLKAVGQGTSVHIQEGSVREIARFSACVDNVQCYSTYSNGINTRPDHPHATCTLTAMGQSESRQRSPPELQQPQKLRRPLRNAIQVLIPRGRQTSVSASTNRGRHTSRRWRRVFCRPSLSPSPSPSLADTEGNKQSSVYEGTEEKGNVNSDSDSEKVLDTVPLDNSGHETSTPVPQLRRVDEEVAPDGNAEEGENSAIDSAVEDISIHHSLDDLDDDIPPIPEAEATREDEDTSDNGEVEEDGDANADLYLSATAQAVPPPPIASSSASPNSASIDNLDDDIPPPIPEAEVIKEDEDTSDNGDVEEEGDADAGLYLSATAEGVPPPLIAGSSASPDSTSLDNLDDDIPPPIPKAEVIKEDEDTSDNGDVEEEGDADADLYLSATTTVAPPPIAGSSASPNSTSLDNWDDDIPPIPEAEVTKEDEDTSDDGDAEKGGDADADLYLSATAQGIPPPPIAGSSASPNSTSLDNWEDNIPSIPEAEVTTEDEATSDDGDVEEEGDADADLYLSTTAQAVPPPPIAGSSVPPNSSSPANASPSSSTDTLVHALPPNAGNVSQAVSALGRRTPSPVRQSPLSRTPGAGNVSQAVSALPRWTPSPVRQSPLSRTPGEGSQGGLPPDLRTGNKCYLCGKLGHWGNSCPEYPAEAKRRAQAVTCWTCGAIGHYATDPACPRRRRRW